jgi:multiple sugar transport system substrate-binding protein
MLFDFDAYALYYRADLFAKKGIAVPKTWDELKAAAKALAEDTNGDGKPDKYLYQVWPDVFHWAQFLFQNGGSILNADNTAAAFNSPEGVAALEFYASLITDKGGMYWGPDQGDQMAAFKDGTLGMFQNGPYIMGVLKSGAPEMTGMWKVALAPYSKQAGSYLGGTGLGIPAAASHKQAAWLFIEYMLRPEQEVGVFTLAGAAPATTAALESPEVAKADPYFGGDAPFGVFLETMKTATHFPYVKAWSEIQTPTIDDAVAAALLGQGSAKEALDTAAEETNTLLKK